MALLQTPTNAIRTIADLLNPAIEIGVQDTPYNRFYFAAATEWSRKKLFETRVEPPNAPNAYMNLTYGVSRMRQGMFAFHTDTGMAYNEVERTWFEHEKCGMVEIRFFSLTDVWYCARKRIPYKEMLKVR